MSNPTFLVYLLYGDFWTLRRICIKHPKNKIRNSLYYHYLEHYGSWIGLGAKIQSPPIFPHGMIGIFISNSAIIGKGVVIYQHVCIGSNMLINSKKYGAPTIEDNVYIGTGAKIIGNVIIGHNSRIGANCAVVKDTPPNSVTVIRGIETIIKNEILNNTFINNPEYANV